MEPKKSKNDDWIKVLSKSRAGRYYMFNRATGETQWLSQSKESDAEAPSGKTLETPPRISLPKPLKTPAQDRLKRLQHAIKVDQIQKPPNKSSRRCGSDLEGRLKKLLDSKEQQENLSNPKPSSSSGTPNKNQQRPSPSTPNKNKQEPSFSTPNKKQKPSPSTPNKNKQVSSPSTPNKNKQTTFPSSTNKNKQKPTQLPSEDLSSPARARKRAHSTVNARPADKEVKKLAQEIPSISPAKNARLNETGVKISSTTQPTKTLNHDFKMVPSNSTPTHRSVFKTPQETDSKTSALNSFRTGIVSKIKEMCKLPFRSSKPQLSRENILETKTSKLLAKPAFKPEKKIEKKTEQVLSAVQRALNELRDEQRKIVPTNLNRSIEASLSPTSMSMQQSTPKNLNIPCYQRGSANSRLDRLRQSLLVQQPSTSSQILMTAAVSPTSSPQTPTATDFNQSVTSLYHTANNTLNDETEDMDWQPIVREETIEVSSSDSNVSLLTQYETKSHHANSTKTGAETMGDIYDTVNENLLRLSAEKQRAFSKNNNKWLKDFYYFVADTNVLLEHLSFIEDLTKLKLCDTKGSMLYIPYCVLQELDKLKMRSGCKEGVKTLAVRAIKYLNKKFENKSQHLLAQTALEERDHLIDVNSADDSIINCCLQAKTQVPNLLLLSEDVNLRNKAICNNILVSTKSDLVSKRYDAGGDSDVSS